MPIDDWQFWIVTAAALWGAWQILRQFLPSRDRQDACGGCAAGAAACAKPAAGSATKGTSLVTIGDGRR